MPAPDLPVDPDLPGVARAEPSLSDRRPAERSHLARPSVLAVVGAGGFVGTLARYQVGLAWPARPGHFPAATFTINTSGAFAIGLVVVLIIRRSPASLRLRRFVIVGVLGGWTTMSTLAVEAVTLSDAGHWVTAAGYLGASLIAGIAAVAAGMVIARATLPRWTATTEAR